MSINSRFLKIFALLARIILLIIFVPVCLFSLITLTFPYWGPSLIAELPEEYKIKATGFHSLTVLWQGQTPVLDQLQITLPGHYRIHMTDLRLSPYSLHLGHLQLTELAASPPPDPLNVSDQDGENPLLEWRPYLLSLIDFLPHRLQIDQLSLLSDQSEQPAYPIIASTLTLKQIDWQQTDISLQGHISAGLFQAGPESRPLLQTDFSTHFSLNDDSFEIDFSGDMQLSNQIIDKFQTSFSSMALNKISVTFQPDQTLLLVPFDMSVQNANLETGITFTSRIDLSPLSSVELPDRTRITFKNQSAKPNIQISAQYQTSQPRPQLNLNWQNIALQIQQQSMSEEIILNGGISLHLDHPELSLHNKVWLENYNLAADLQAVTQIKDLKTRPGKITLNWQLPRFSTLNGQTDVFLTERQKQLSITSQTKASQIDLRELRQVVTLFQADAFPRELIDMDGTLNLSLKSKLLPKMSHQGQVKLMVQEMLYKNSKSFEAKISELGAGFDFTVNKTHAQIITRKNLKIAKIRVKSEQKEMDVQPEQNFNNLVMAGQIQHAFPNRTKFDLHHFSTNWLEGALSLKPTIFKTNQKAYHFTVTGQKLNLAKLAKYWQISGLEIDGRLDGDIPLTYYPQTKSIRIGNGFLKSSRPGVIAYKPGPQSVTHQTLSQYGQIVEQALENFHFKILEASLQRDQNDELSILLKLQGRNPDLHNGRPINFNLSLSGDLEKIVQQSLAILYFPQSLSERLRLDKIKKHTRPSE